MGFCNKLAVVVALLGVGIYSILPGDILKGISSDIVLSGLQIHLAIAGFCLSPIPDKLMKEQRGRDIGGDFEFADDGDIGVRSLPMHPRLSPACDPLPLPSRVRPPIVARSVPAVS